MLAAEEVRRFGLAPRVALLSHSSFGTADTPSARKMREALATDPRTRARARGRRRDARRRGAVQARRSTARAATRALTAEANLLIMPNLDAANITFNVLKIVAGEGVTVGPDPARRRQAGAHPDARPAPCGGWST